MLIIFFFALLYISNGKIIFQKINLDGRKEITVLANKIGSGAFELKNIPLGSFLIIKFRLNNRAEIILDERNP